MLEELSIFYALIAQNTRDLQWLHICYVIVAKIDHTVWSLKVAFQKCLRWRSVISTGNEGALLSGYFWKCSSHFQHYPTGLRRCNASTHHIRQECVTNAISYCIIYLIESVSHTYNVDKAGFWNSWKRFRLIISFPITAAVTGSYKFK